MCQCRGSSGFKNTLLFSLFSLTFFVLSIPGFCQSKYRKDFDFFWKAFNDDFGYFDVQKTNWQKVYTLYSAAADTVTTRPGLITLLERINHELYNGHITLNTNLPSSYRMIPSGSDTWLNYGNGKFWIAAVRKGSKAERCGLKVGMQVIAINGVPVQEAIRELLPRSVEQHDQQMFEYAANVLAAGRHDTKRTFLVEWNKQEAPFQPDNIPDTGTNIRELLTSRLLKDRIAYIKINNSLGNIDLIHAFDSVLNKLSATKGLVLDLTDTPGGGNTTVARAIMSRFISKELPYQKHTLPAEEKQFGVKRSWVEWVSPRGWTYKNPLIVIVGRWTGSMGEGLAIGFDGMKRAAVVGDRMAGLLGAIYSYTLPETGIGFSVPVEKLFHVNGTPREQFVPAIVESDSEKCLSVAVSIIRKAGLAGKHK